MKEFIITEHEAGQRLDRFLSKLLPHASKGLIQKWVRTKTCSINRVRIKNPATYLTIGDRLQVFLQDKTYDQFAWQKYDLKRASNPGMPIVYEDEELLVVNKPRGLLTHPDSEEYVQTAATKVLAYLAPYVTSTFRPAPIHRLDKNTTGLLLFSKTYEAAKKYNQLMRSREIKKVYQCLVEGDVSENGQIDAWIYKNKGHNKSRISWKEEPGGKRCITKYQVLERVSTRAGVYTILAVTLVTGRSHQIRASLSAVGHPIVGDKKYGAHRLNGGRGQLLHCWKIKVDGKSWSCDSPDIINFIKGEQR